MRDRGSVTNPGVELRDLIRSQARREAYKFDQVVLGTVLDPGDSVTVSIQIDGFAAGGIDAAWASPVTPVAGQRVTVLLLAGGQQFFVTGVVDALITGTAGGDAAADYVIPLAVMGA